MAEPEEKIRGREIIHKELPFEIIAAAIEVHKELGPGFTENIYEEAFCRELELRNIPFERQAFIEIAYKGHSVGSYKLDLSVEKKVVVELKAVSQMPDDFEYKLHSYLKATRMKLGLLINFGKKSLEYRRIVK